MPVRYLFYPGNYHSPLPLAPLSILILSIISSGQRSRTRDPIKLDEVILASPCKLISALYYLTLLRLVGCRLISHNTCKPVKKLERNMYKGISAIFFKNNCNTDLRPRLVSNINFFYTITCLNVRLVGCRLISRTPVKQSRNLERNMYNGISPIFQKRF